MLPKSRSRYSRNPELSAKYQASNMSLAARKLKLRINLRPDSVCQLLAERAKHRVLSLAVSVNKYNEFVRGAR